MLGEVPRQVRLAFERRADDAALTNDRLQRSDSEFRMVWYRDRNGAEIGVSLHDDVASSVADLLKTVLSRMLQTSRPERTRSLPIGRFEASHKHLRVEPALDFSGIG
jgi:hypothetical protein